MMNYRLYILGVLLAILSFISCKDNYYIENDLHGMWQITSIQKSSTGEVVKPKGTLYYLFQRSMVSLCYNYLNVPERIDCYIAHFDFIESDSIRMGQFRVSTTGEGDNVNKEEIVGVESLYKFGIHQDYTIFHMGLSKQSLILTSDSARIVLRKY